MVDEKELVEQFTKVIEYSQDVTPKRSEEVISNWHANKQYYIDKFSGNLIYEYPEEVSIKLSEDEKKSRFSNFLDLVINEYHNDDLGRFIGLNGVKGFYDNKVTIDEEDREISKGMKLIKSFKFFEPNKELLEDLQNKASMIIQEDKITGKLCLSVHPLDFLSISENTYHWRSCHALDGDYRAGNISYMLDYSTIVCYLRGNNLQANLPRFPDDVPWNDKKWRCLLYFSDNKRMVFAGKGYPFQNKEILDIIREILIDLELVRIGDSAFFEETLSNWSNEYVDTFNGRFTLPESYLVTGDTKLIGLFELVKDVKNSCHYNDILYSHNYVPYYAQITSTLDPLERPLYTANFRIGADTKCLGCGQVTVPVGEGTMFCDDCWEKYRVGRAHLICDQCWEKIDEEPLWVDGVSLCEECYNEYTAPCSDCGERHFKRCMVLIDGKWICPSCIEKRRAE